MTLPFTRRIMLGASLAVPAIVSARAQDAFPTHPVRLVVPFPPGGSTDVIGRIIAAAMQERLKQTVVVDNRPGASGTVGSASVSRSPADGYTILFSNIASQGVMPALSPGNVPYDPVKDFTHIGMIGVYWAVLLVNPKFPAKTLAEFIAEAKKHPGEINFATSGIGSSPHLFVEMLKAEAGINIVHVPYRGAGPALSAILANEVPAMGDSLPSSTPHIRSGALRALGVSSAQRVPAFPNLPTFAEQGFPRMAIDNWYGISGPPDMPAPVVATLTAALNDSLKDPAVIERMRTLGLEPRIMNGEAFGSFIENMFALWKDTVRIANIHVD